jgi:hypothetical protein
MNNISLLILTGFSLLLGACASEDESNASCISFDIRQCNADPWALNGLDRNAEEDVLNDIKNYLESQQIDVVDIGIDIGFHQFVCEACTVCPSGPRVYVKSDLSGVTDIEALGLLNFEQVNCNAIFQ